ncbi:MAG: ABC transporter permease [Acidimicrobiia bacterium]
MTAIGLAPIRSGAAWSAFFALLRRDARVLWKTKIVFALRTIIQPLLTVFVFAYVFPKIGQGIGGDNAMFATLLAPGLIAVALIFQGIQAVALPLVQEFGYTREIEDRVMAPLPIWAIAVEKITSGAIQAFLAALVVLPFVYLIPSSPVHLTFHWLQVVTVVPLACILAGALGLTIGTRVDVRQVPLLFSVIVVPMTFLGCSYYPWRALEAIRWLQIAVLINPLVYMSEGLRMSMTTVPHMATWGIYVALVGFVTGLSWLGITGFRSRVVS